MGGSQLASLLKVHLSLKGIKVFLDVEKLQAGKFHHDLLTSIKSAKNFLLVLTPHSLDRCIEDKNCDDWIHKEIVEALKNKCNIIPITYEFEWPNIEKIPEDMRPICQFNAVSWVHEFVSVRERFPIEIVLFSLLISNYNCNCLFSTKSEIDHKLTLLSFSSKRRA